MILLVVLSAFLLGCSLVFGSLAFFYHVEYFTIGWQIWVAVASLSLIALIIFLCLIFRKKKPEEEIPSGDGDALRAQFEKFEQEYKQVLRGHLKISILFWTFFYKKEKVKSFDDARREVFGDFRKELPHIKWMEEMLEEIRVELTKYK